MRTFAFGAIAAAVWALDRNGFRVHLPVGLHEVAGFIIALILAFRTNTAYARFWEGRTLWGGIVNASRNLTRAVTRYGGLDAEASRAFTAWVVVFAHATRRSLRAQNEAPEIDRLLPEDAREPFAKARHRPLYAAGRLSEQIADLGQKGALDPMMRAHAEGQLAALVDYLGGCERIEKTPTPVGYVLLLERAIAFYLATIPFAVVDPLGSYVVLVTMMVAYLVLMIEALGRELDNPFGHEPNDLPLSRICSKIEYDLLGSSPEELLKPKGARVSHVDLERALELWRSKATTGVELVTIYHALAIRGRFNFRIKREARRGPAPRCERGFVSTQMGAAMPRRRGRRASRQNAAV